MAFLLEMDAHGYLDPDAVKDKGLALREAYQSSQPFPHTVIDDFLPQSLLDLCLGEFSDEGQEGSRTFDRDQERLKRQYTPDRMSPPVRGLFYAFNSKPFIRVLENITGIKGLIPDPFFLGAGFHEILTGGHLSVHTDFDHHPNLDLERRINVLIYLNEGWEEGFGGQLELWDDAMEHCEVSLVPLLNRCVIFNTSGTSNHGNPQQVAHPYGISRKSIALYYYTATWDADRKGLMTQFQVRPGSEDKSDWKMRTWETATELLPPVVSRAILRIARARSGSG